MYDHKHIKKHAYWEFTPTEPDLDMSAPIINDELSNMIAPWDLGKHIDVLQNPNTQIVYNKNIIAQAGQIKTHEDLENTFLKDKVDGYMKGEYSLISNT